MYYHFETITFDGNPSPFIHRTPTSPTESPAFFPVVAHNGSESVGIGIFSGENTSTTHLFRSENKLAKTVWCGGLYTCVLMTDGTLYFAGKVPGIGIRS